MRERWLEPSCHTSTCPFIKNHLHSEEVKYLKNQISSIHHSEQGYIGAIQFLKNQIQSLTSINQSLTTRIQSLTTKNQSLTTKNQ